jgi:type IV secretion system protein TrbI
MAVMFSKNPAKPAPKQATAPPFVGSSDMNQRRIQELEQDLTADQGQMQRQARNQRDNAGEQTVEAQSVANPAQPGTMAPATPLPPPVATQPTEPSRDPVADAEKALAFRARFASNLVSPDDSAARPSLESAESADDLPARSSSLPQATAAQSAPAAAITGNKRAPEVNVNAAHGQPYVVFEGTSIDTVLVNRLDGEFAGPLKVMVTNPVYSQDRQHLLIPEGTFILGDVQKVGGSARNAWP